MRILITFYFLFFITVVRGQEWQLMTTGTTQNLNSVSFSGKFNGWAVGENGTVIHSADGGYNWTNQVSNTTGSLKSVSVSGSQTAWAVGAAGTIIYTSNGGALWTVQNSGSSQNLNSVFFINENKGWITGLASTLLYTLYGGVQWNIIVSTQIPSNPNSVFFADDNTGWIAANSGLISKTTDGGITWSLQSSGTSQNLMSLFFTDANTGWAVGYSGTILKTVNGGTTWTPQVSGVTSALFSVAFSDSDNGIISGNSGIILKTTNGGTTWVSENSGTTLALKSVCSLPEKISWISGNTGTILRQAPVPQICIVTVDTLTQKNKIIWDRAPGMGIASYKIFRLDGSIYNEIASVPYSSLSEYIDINSTPSVVSARYKISAVDSMGNESMKSPYHQTINLTASQGVPSTTVSLLWNYYEDESNTFVPDYYYIYRGSSPDTMSLYNTVSAAVNMYNDENVFSTFYYFITVDKPVPCVSTGDSKEVGGPYGSSYSNMEENLVGSAELISSGYRLSVFPNPAYEHARIKLPEGFSAVSDVKVYDLCGRKIQVDFSTENSELILFTGDLEPGLYFFGTEGSVKGYGSFVVNK